MVVIITVVIINEEIAFIITATATVYDYYYLLSYRDRHRLLYNSLKIHNC